MALEACGRRACRQLVVLTGAGCSTESGIPDYRGPQGAYQTGFKPMMHQQVGTSLALLCRALHAGCFCLVALLANLAAEASSIQH